VQNKGKNRRSPLHTWKKHQDIEQFLFRPEITGVKAQLAFISFIILLMSPASPLLKDKNLVAGAGP